MKTLPDDSHWCWFASERSFCIAFLRSLGFSLADAEELFSALKEWWRKAELRGKLPDRLERGILTHRLRQLVADFVRRRDAGKRGNDQPHVACHSAWEWDQEPSASTDFLYPDDRIEALFPLLDRHERQVTGRQKILCLVWRRALQSGERSIDLVDWFTPEERERFVGHDRPSSERDFRKQISRTQSELVKALRQKVASN